MITPSYSITATERVLPNLALDFTTASLDARVTFTRTTDATHPATYVASTGYITTAANNAARFDYDPVALTCKGLLIEESRANVLVYSSDYTQANWQLIASGTRSFITANATTSPDGTNNATKLYAGVITGATSGFLQAYTLAATTTYTASVYLKYAGFRWIYFGTDNGSGYEVWFDIQNGVVGTQSANYTGTITNAGNGFYRCTITFKTGTASTVNAILLAPANADAQLVVNGDGTKGMYVYGVQLEVGAFATSYIPTTSAALTRNTDNAIMTGTNFSSWYNASAGTIVANASRFGVPTGSYTRVVSLDDGTNSNVIRLISYIATASAEYTVTTATASIADIYTNDNAWPLNTYAKSSLGFKANSFYAAFNGAEMPGGNNVVTGAVPTVTQLQIGKAGTVEGKNFWIKSIYYYPQMLTKNEIISISK